MAQNLKSPTLRPKWQKSTKKSFMIVRILKCSASKLWNERTCLKQNRLENENLLQCLFVEVFHAQFQAYTIQTNDEANKSALLHVLHLSSALKKGHKSNSVSRMKRKPPHLGLSINECIPQNRWFISWKILSKWMTRG